MAFNLLHRGPLLQHEGRLLCVEMAERQVFASFATVVRRCGALPRQPYPSSRTLEPCRRHSTQQFVSVSRARRRTGVPQPEQTRLTRSFATTQPRSHNDLVPPKPGEERKITFITKAGDSHTFEVADGSNLLDIAQAHDLEMEGACGGSCACSTCHVIVQGEEMYDKMEEPSDDENDMLDLAFGLTETSRLGCQVVMSKELDGLVVKLPSMTRNMQASDFGDGKK